MEFLKRQIMTLLLICFIISSGSSCQKQDIPIETSMSEPTTSAQSNINTDNDIFGVFLLVYDQKKGEEKRDVSELIKQGFRMTAHFYEDGKGYISPGAGIEEFTWGNGIITKASGEMTYTFEDGLLIIEDIESQTRFWYERTDEALGEYPVISDTDLP